MTVRIYQVSWYFDRQKTETYLVRRDAMRRANDLVSHNHKVTVKQGIVPAWTEIPPAKWDKVHS